MRVRTVLAAVAAAGTAIAAVAAVTAGTFAYADTRPRIVGGQPASQTYSFMGSLQNAFGDQICGAVLIKPNVALTAAHCVDGEVDDPTGLRVRVNTSDRTRGGERAKVTKATVHPLWDPITAAHDDIAVIRLDTKLQATPIEIGQSPAVGAPVRIMGWGLTCPTRDCGEHPVQLNELNTTVLDDTRCQDALGGINSGNEICLDNPNGNSGACFGDSGGPAVIDEGGTLKLVGVIARDLATECAIAPSISSDVRAQKKFIDSALR